MLIGIISDSHGNQRNVLLALELLQDRGVECILHCGDIDDAETVRLFKDVPTHFVLGNCDWDVEGITRAAESAGANLHGRFASLELGGCTIAVIHGDDSHRLDQAIVQSDAYDYVFYGHTHNAETHQVGITTVVNPGALHRARPKTIALLDTSTREMESIIVAK